MKEFREYEKDNRTIHLLEGDIFLDFEVHSNDTDQVQAFITTDQDRWEDLDILILYLRDSISVNSVQVVASREDSLHISPDSQRRPLQVISMKTNPLLKEMLTQGEIYPGGSPRSRRRHLPAV